MASGDRIYLGELGKQSHEVYDGAVSTTKVTYDMELRTITQISYISNDDLTNDLYISFDDTVLTAVVKNGLSGVIRLLPGESITDMGRKCSKIHFIRLAGTGNVRFLGV